LRKGASTKNNDTNSLAMNNVKSSSNSFWIILGIWCNMTKKIKNGGRGGVGPLFGRLLFTF
jgi:hypothetical protein